MVSTLFRAVRRFGSHEIRGKTLAGGGSAGLTAYSSRHFVDPGSLEEMGCLPRMAASLSNFLVVKHKKPLGGWLLLEVFKFHEPIHETFSKMLSQLYRYSKCCHVTHDL